MGDRERAFKTRYVLREIVEARVEKKGLLAGTLAVILAVSVFFPFNACGFREDKGTPHKQAPLLGPGDHERKLHVGGMERTYYVHVPSSTNRDRPTAVVLNLHGGGGTPEAQQHTSAMNEVSDSEGFVVVYPQGSNRPLKLIKGYTWNAGTCCGWAREHEIDDVAFINALLDDLEKVIHVDKKRIYATGHSNGAMMCYRLACELSNRIAAIAPVSGPMQMTACRPSRPVPVMHFHGTADAFVPIEGGKGPKSFLDQGFNSVKETLDFWIKNNGIESGKPSITRHGKAVKKSYGAGEDGAEVVLWEIEGGGHTWPGGRFGFFKERVLGEMNTDISASRMMWEFFKKHPLP